MIPYVDRLTEQDLITKTYAVYKENKYIIKILRQ